MDAAVELLIEGGPDALTVDGVVARSGVAKSTFYRHWETRDQFVASVFEHMAPTLDPPDPSLGFEDSLRQLVGRLAEIMSDERWRRVLPAFMQLKMHHGNIAEVEQRISSEQLGVCGGVLQRGVAAGLIDPDADPQVLVTLLMGPVLMAGLTGAPVMDAAFVDAVVDHFLAGARRHAAAAASRT
jgi:AcrR family transcriptional regulator